MTQSEIHDALQAHFGDKPGFDQKASQQIAHALANATSVIASESHVAAVKHPSSTQQSCYKTCETTRDAALAAAALKGWPLGAVAAGAAIMAFNACRHQCDQKR